MVLHILVAVAAVSYVAGLLPLDRLSAAINKKLGVSDRAAAIALVFTNILKGIAVVSLAAQLGPEAAQFSALFLFLGHAFPIHREFQGGNGMGALLGALIGLNATLGFVALASWTFAYFVFRYSRTSAYVSAIMTPIVCGIYDIDAPFALLFFFAAIVVWRNRHCFANIAQSDDVKAALE